MKALQGLSPVAGHESFPLVKLSKTKPRGRNCFKKNSASPQGNQGNVPSRLVYYHRVERADVREEGGKGTLLMGYLVTG